MISWGACLDFLLRLASFGGGLDSEYGFQHQQPLDSPGVQHLDHHASTDGVSFTVPGTSFTCQYPTMAGYTACNTAKNRSCWLQGPNKNSFQYDINTAYDMPGDEFAPDGIEREYWLEVSVDPIAPDGYLKPLGQVFNHTYPGPHLEACWGDQFVIHVTNKIPNLGTTVHWHGIRQLNTSQQDGVNGVTQCPIAYDETYTYRFRADQYGHTWYHSHYQTQYSDGVAGPLTIYGPSSANWDETFEPIMISDWVHENTSVVFREELAQSIPVADSIVLGGTSIFKCSSLDPFCCGPCNAASTCREGVDPEFCCDPDPRCFANSTDTSGNAVQVLQGGGTFNKTFEEGKKYLLQLINASAEAMFIFMIDDHELEVIEADLVPIKPYKTDSVFIAIGQRYQVIVTAKPKKKSAECQADVTQCNYWMRTRIATGCGTVAQDDEETGIIQYSPNRGARTLPETIAPTEREDCADEPDENLIPVVPWNVSTLRNARDLFTFNASFDNVSTHGAFRWELTNTPLFLDYANPSILNVDNTTYFDDPFKAVVNYTNPEWNGGFVYLVITGNSILQVPGKVGVPAAHPIHLHGHDFVILAQLDKTWDGQTIPQNHIANPTRRDVALLYAGGYLALAFKLDNPGIWLVHCHIAWHASSGLALQIVERQNEILGSIGSLDNTQQTCAGWDEMGLKFQQEDSGI